MAAFAVLIYLLLAVAPMMGSPGVVVLAVLNPLIVLGWVRLGVAGGLVLTVCGLLDP